MSRLELIRYVEKILRKVFYWIMMSRSIERGIACFGRDANRAHLYPRAALPQSRLRSGKIQISTCEQVQG
jgi:hypothetical protein